jgi:hypothetical protein
MELLAALSLVDLGDRRRVREACRALVVSHRDHNPIFDRAFDLYFGQVWEQLARQEQSSTRTVAGVPPEDMPELPESELPGDPDSRVEFDPSQTRIAPESDEERDATGDEVPEAQTYSAAEILRHKDFDRYSAEELARARDLMRQLRLRPATHRVRRMVRSPRGKQLDMRAVVRGMQRTAGEPVRLHRRERKEKRRKLVLLCDVSGSMEAYTRALVLFLHAAVGSGRGVEVFAFGTRLTRLTDELRTRDPERALEAATGRVVDWAGGTRIGASLKTFNDVWGRRALTRGAAVVVVSDGWEREDVSLIDREMARLHRAAYAIVWVNPLKGSPEYQPLAGGMRAALPYVDRFVSGHNLASLERLASVLSGIERRHAA